MALANTLTQYRMSIALAVGLLGPTVGGFLFGLAGLTGPGELNALTTLVVWGVGIWAIGTAGWELVRGYRRWRGTADAEPAAAGA